MAAAAVAAFGIYAISANADVRPMIVGGTSAPSGWGFVAFVENSAVGFRCSGTVVAPELVLTAGHYAASELTSVPYSPSGYMIYTGNVDWQDGTPSAVSQVIPYPGFTPVTTPTAATSPMATRRCSY